MNTNLIKHTLNVVFCFALLCSCADKKNSAQADKEEENPPCEGFDMAGSDAKAIEIADKVMVAMGGRKNWDQERFFQWNFFGSRTLWWDKLNGDVRIEMHKGDSSIYLINIFDDAGRVFKNGAELTQPDSVAKYMKKAKGIWINDAYWLFMPFKLKDTGVTLKYVGEGATESGIASDIIQLTFKNVGNTPQNKYHVWVDKSDHLVKQWAFFRENDKTEPNFVNPWQAYTKHGSLLLSGDRGKRKITDIHVAGKMDETTFTSF